MSFDVLAPHYRWMEWVLAGSKLQRCRTAFLQSIPAPRNVLLLGEGHGRFLTALVEKHPDVKVICVDASVGMLNVARERLEASGLKSDNVQFVHTNILDWQPPSELFDLIVTHFFLDCFRPDQLERIVSRLAGSSAPKASWLLADFCEPTEGYSKWRARMILWSMYRFFRAITRIPAARLVAPDPFLCQSGFTLGGRRTFDWGLLHSDLWVRRDENVQ